MEEFELFSPEQLRFTVPEIVSLIGLTQCVYVMVYMVFRAGDLRRAFFPFFYFLILGSAFFLDFSERFIGSMAPYYHVWQWGAWFLGPPLGVLLAIQVAQISRIPALSNFWVLLLIPSAYAAAWFMAAGDESCHSGTISCTVFQEWLTVLGLVAGASSVFALWSRRGLLQEVRQQKGGKDRYWLIMTLVIVNLLFLGVMLLGLTPALTESHTDMIRTFLGLGFVYLAGTSLFRIYPQAVHMVDRYEKGLTREEKELAHRIERLITVEKVYQEASYTRTDLARELEIPESVLSRVINHHFGKSFPRLVNEKRIAEAQRLLAETDAPVKVIAGEVGFSSLASFNRVFRDITGMTPSAHRGINTKNK